MIFAHSLLHSIAIARPMPDEAPVTRIVFPISEKGLCIIVCLLQDQKVLEWCWFCAFLQEEVRYHILHPPL